jgi:large subunit ribosomal protein L23
MKADQILIQPLVTEKTSRMAGTNVYAFVVHEDANKNHIAAALIELYGVEIGEIKVMNRKGKVKRVGRKGISKQRPTRKIAYVTVTKGTLSVFPKV